MIFENVLAQYRPVVPTQQGHTFLPSASQQFRHAGQGISTSNMGMPGSQVQPPHFPHSVQQVPSGSSQPGYTLPSQALPLQYAQTNRPLSSSSSLPHQGVHFSNQMPGLFASAAAPPPYSVRCGSHFALFTYMVGFCYPCLFSQVFTVAVCTTCLWPASK